MGGEEALRGKALVLTYCTKRKRRKAGRAREVYAGPVKNLFALSEAIGAKCYILSAKYGLISCDDYVESYDLYLKELGRESLNALREAVSRKCGEVEGAWDVAVINMSQAYSEAFPCTIRARRALVIGKFRGVAAERLVKVVPRTLGERAKVLRALGRVRSLEDLVRLIEEGALDGELDPHFFDGVGGGGGRV